MTYFLLIKFRNDRMSVNFLSVLPSVSRLSTRDVTRVKVGYLPNTENEGITCVSYSNHNFPHSFFLAWIFVLSKHLWIFFWSFPHLKIKKDAIEMSLFL